MSTSSENFGPLARFTKSGSSSQAVLQTSVFQKSFTAEVKDARGEKIADVEYKVLHPSGGIAYFHLLLDASSSTRQRVSTGDKKRVYEYLFQNFEHLVEGRDSPLLPNDMICIWAFNWKTTPLCRVEKKNYYAQREAIRAAYKTEVQGNKHQGTRLYDTIATAMDKIWEQYKAHPKADFFLVPFTDGVDHGSENHLHTIMGSINGIGARLHTIFITASIPHTCELYKRLESQKKEISHIKCENTEPTDISAAFSMLRNLMIKALMMVFHQKGGKLEKVTRIAAYGDNEQDVAKVVMENVKAAGPSLIDGWYEMNRI